MTDCKGTTWRYAVTRERIDDGHFYEIREVYTNADGELSWTADPIAPHGETVTELTEALTRMTSAATGPVLDLTVDPPEWVNQITIRRRDREDDDD